VINMYKLALIIRDEYMDLSNNQRSESAHIETERISIQFK